MMPILEPAGVQEILDYGLYGFAMSRYASVWVGIKCLKDTIEVDRFPGRRHRSHRDRHASGFRDAARRPLHPARATSALERKRVCRNTSARDPGVHPREQTRPHRHRAAAPNPKSASSPAARAISTCARRWTSSASTRSRPTQLGIRLYKVGMTWPLEPQGVLKFAQGLDTILVDRGEALADRDPDQGAALRFHSQGAGQAAARARQKGRDTRACSRPSTRSTPATSPSSRRAADPRRRGADIKDRVAELKRLKGNRPESAEAAPASPISARAARTTPRPSCPKARAPTPASAATTWRTGWTARPKASPRWAARAPTGSARRRSPRRQHVFQNLGDGTYIHSGSAGDPRGAGGRRQMTYKILYNDAVAMTGGQPARRRHDVRHDRAPGAAPRASRSRRRHRRAGQVSARRFHACRACPCTRATNSQRCSRSCARSRASPCSSTTRPARPRSAGAASAAQFPDPDKRAFINGGVRRLRRLRREVELRGGPAAGDRVRPQARDRPVELQQGLLLPQRLLPELRHRRMAAKLRKSGAARAA